MLATIGYERATLADFIATLQRVNVDVLIDIRERAQSRRPGFSKKSLATALDEAGISYLHLPELGDPKEGRDAARAGNMTRFADVFRGVLATPSAQAAMRQIEGLATKRTVCLMCFERDQNDCHRKIVADSLEERLSVKARHLGVAAGAANDSDRRRVLHFNQSVASPL